MVVIDPIRFKRAPYPRQLTALRRLLDIDHYGLFWRMRLGKSKVATDAACLLYEAGLITAVILVGPSQALDAWLDPKLGELQAHCFLPYQVWRAGRREPDRRPGRMFWTAASYEYLRQENAQGEFYKLEEILLYLAKDKVMVIMDEGSELGNHAALQTKAMMRLRYSTQCHRSVLLDGTPEGNHQEALFSKLALVNTSILGYRNFFVFRALHMEIINIKRSVWDEVRKVRKEKVVYQKVRGYKDMEIVTQKAAPFVEYLDAGDSMGVWAESLLTVALSPATWKVYREMRDDLCANLTEGTVEVNHAAVKVLRLAQICSGFIGGVSGLSDQADSSLDLDIGDSDNDLGSESATANRSGLTAKPVVELSHETLTGVLRWLRSRYEEDSNFKCVIWCRWRSEIERLQGELFKRTPRLGVVYGGHKSENFLHPSHPYDGPGIMVCQPQAAKYANNYSKARAAVYLSQGYEHVIREQSKERVRMQDGRKETLLLDVLVTGPNGEKTVVHDIITALRTAEDLGQRTVRDWILKLKEE